MKVQADTTFRPVTITLESPDEVAALRDFLGNTTLGDKIQAQEHEKNKRGSLLNVLYEELEEVFPS